VPNPWDRDKIRQNLRDLASIQAGNKLQYLDDGFIRINSFALLRGERDSITNDRARNLTVRLIHEAVAVSRQAGAPDRVSRRDIEQALAGLERLRETYPDGDKRQALDRLLSEARAELTNAQEQSPRADRAEDVRAARAAFYDAHGHALMVRVDQHELLGLDDAGVCKFFTIDWARRVLLKKPTYAYSKKFFPDPLEDRLQRKVDKRLREMETSFMDWGRRGWVTGGYGVRSPSPGFVPGPYAGMVFPVNMAKGVERYEVVEIFRKSINEGYEDRQDGRARDGEGREVFTALLDQMVQLAGQATEDGLQALFNVHLRGRDVDLNQNGAHVIGFDLTGGAGTLHFFDCNFGEFQLCLQSDRDRTLSLFEDLWKYYAIAGLAVSGLWLMQWKCRPKPREDSI
jgi:hypothetical protein